MTNDEIRQKFILYPEHSDDPIFIDEEGSVIGYGHIPEKEFLQKARNLNYYLQADDIFETEDELDEAVTDVCHTYGVVSGHKDYDFWVDWSKDSQNSQDSVPLTLFLI